jgi:hypothetical protein
MPAFLDRNTEIKLFDAEILSSGTAETDVEAHTASTEEIDT